MTGALDESGDYGLSMSYKKTKTIFNQQNQRDFPGVMKVVERIKGDLSALRKLCDHSTPLKRLMRRKDVCTTQYGFGDALGSGSGASWE